MAAVQWRHAWSSHLEHLLGFLTGFIPSSSRTRRGTALGLAPEGQLAPQHLSAVSTGKMGNGSDHLSLSEHQVWFLLLCGLVGLGIESRATEDVPSLEKGPCCAAQDGPKSHSAGLPRS